MEKERKKAVSGKAPDAAFLMQKRTVKQIICLEKTVA